MTGRQDGGKSRQRRGLSADDWSLWDHVAQSIERRATDNARLPDIPGLDRIDAHQQRECPGPPEAKPPRPLRRPGIEPAQWSPPPQLPTHQLPPPADLDRKAVRRIRSGRIAIDARLDLHGMRQDEAHRALRGFLSASQARGLRWVLVITGKGRPPADDEGHEARPLHAGEGRGVLKRNVPRWLAEPDLRPIVVSYTTAALHHGGEGALYIQLRTRR